MYLTNVCLKNVLNLQIPLTVFGVLEYMGEFHAFTAELKMKNILLPQGQLYYEFDGTNGMILE